MFCHNMSWWTNQNSSRCWIAQVMSKLVYLSQDYIFWLHLFNFHLNCELFLTCTYLLFLITTPVVPWKTFKSDRFEQDMHTWLAPEREWLLSFVIFTFVEQWHRKGVWHFCYDCCQNCIFFVFTLFNNPQQSCF